MELREFAEAVKEQVQENMGSDYEVKIQQVTKNNGLILTGVTISENECNIAPTIYVDDYFKAFVCEEMRMEQIIEDVIEVHERNKINKSVDIGFFTDFDRVKEKIIFTLINFDKNQDFLQDVPHVKIMDLAVIFKVLVSEEEYGDASITIHNAHLKLWDVTSEEIFEIAKVNTPDQNKYLVQNMKDMIAEMMKLSDEEREELEDTSNMPGISMYVLTNQRKLNGAGCMIYKDLLKDFAYSAGSDLYIIPSSIHELLLLPIDGSEDVEYLRNMVKEVNDTQLKAEEILSNNVYLYRRENDELSIA